MSAYSRSIDLPTRAARETAMAHGITPDRCDILQNGSTLVLRLTETLVARVVQDVDGPRQGSAWFARENAIAQHLTEQGAPVIPLHPDLPKIPHVHLGYTLNFWKYVTAIDEEPDAEETGRTLYQCHSILRSFPEPLPKLAILAESLDLIDSPASQQHFPAATRKLLHDRLQQTYTELQSYPDQPLHGDAHMGNLMNTTRGLLWTDWEDAFTGPVEWDVASLIWNAKLIEQDHETVNKIQSAYLQAGGQLDERAMELSLIARAAVMSIWYPILYPNPNAERKVKLQHRLNWLEQISMP